MPSDEAVGSIINSALPAEGETVLVESTVDANTRTISANQIRNIIQTHQEREVIKLAPDVVVFIEGKPYLYNYFGSEGFNNDGKVIYFNDFLSSFSSNYSVDNLVPTASIGLSIPVDMKNMLNTPGGGHIIQTMMGVQAYCKGYYFSADGSSLYHRILNGIISHVNYSDNGKTLEVSIQCTGILSLYDYTHIDLSPAVQTNSSTGAVGTGTNQANLNAYMQLAFTFLHDQTWEGFISPQLNMQPATQSVYSEAIARGYIRKWGERLKDIRRDVHVFGLDAKNIKQRLEELSKNSAQIANADTAADAGKTVLNRRASDQAKDILQQAIREYLPEMSVGSVRLLNGNVVTRLERLRSIASVIGYEAYQDVDGSVVIKPPLWNLDVTEVGEGDPVNGLVYTKETNPFVVYQSELLSGETETEDQAAIRLTRILVTGAMSTTYQLNVDQSYFTPADYTDVKLLSQFGLRQEPTKPLGMICCTDKSSLFAYAIHELTKANRGFRTYDITIPARPELKMGFPCYIPHRDMYGYIRSASFSYTQGGEATMSVSMDCIRARPLIEPSTPQMDSEGKEIKTFVSQPNLVHKFTTSGDSSPSPSPTPVDVMGEEGKHSFTAEEATTGRISGTSGDVVALPISTPDPSMVDASKIRKYGVSILKNCMGVENTDTVSCYRIQNDDALFTTKRPCDMSYLKDIQKAQPYTDDKGYELIGPLPWGRWKTLMEAISETTQSKIYEDDKTSPDLVELQKAQSFVFMGMAADDTTTEKLFGKTTKVFKLKYSDPEQQMTEDIANQVNGDLNRDEKTRQVMLYGEKY